MKKTIVTIACTLLLATLSSQSVTTYAGSQYVGTGQYSGQGSSSLLTEKFSMPVGVCFDTSKRIYITDMHNVSVLTNGTSYTRGGYVQDPTDGGAIGDQDGIGITSRFAFPSGVAVDPRTNDVYICDRENSLIRKGNRYVNPSNPTIWGTHAGVSSFIGGHKDGSLSTAEFSSPYDIEISSNGIMYVSDFGNEVIRKISGSTVSTIIGSPGNAGDAEGTGSSARIDTPVGIFLDGDNTLYIADRNNGKIRKVNLSTMAMTTAVTGLTAPTDMVVLGGVIYIADNNCIKTWDGSSLKVLAGANGVIGYNDGAIASARFGDIDLMTIDKDNELIYIVDAGNNVLRRMSIDNSPKADFVASKTEVSLNETIKLTSISTFAQSLLWSITPGTYTLQVGSKLTDNVIYVSFDNAQSYSVSLKAVSGIESNTETKSNWINVSNVASALPVADFEASKTTPNAGEEVQLIDKTVNNPTGWSWTITPSTGWSVTGGTTPVSRNPKITFNNAGKYTVELNSTNANGSNKATKTEYIQVPVGRVQNMSSAFNVYPNPSNGVLNITGARFDNAYLVNTIGQKFELENSSNSTNFDMSQFKNGTYVLVIKVGEMNYSRTVVILN